MKPLITSLFLLSSFSSTVLAQGNDMLTRWNQPIKPFQIADNLYYVGTNEIGSYLITGSAGHIIIDGGFEETAPLILDSVRKLGFEAEDVEILLNTHAHFDHAAGLAELKAATGASLYISEPDTEIIERGGKDDYLLGNSGLFPAVEVDHQLIDEEVVVLGDIKLTARVTAGHTKGCTSWVMEVEEKGETLDVVLVCSFSILPMARLVNEPSYPGISDDYARTFEILESLPCDIFISPHGQFFDLKGKIELLASSPAVNPFINPDRYTEYVRNGKKKYIERLEKERSEQ